jgi:folate-binding protein YgfZ
MPSLAEQHHAVREAAGLRDRSDIGKAEVEGRDRVSFLQGMLSNDVKALTPGQGCAAAFLDAHGKVMALLRVYALADRLLLELPPRLTEKTLQLLDKYLISEKVSFEPMDEAYAVLSLQGPRAHALLEGLAGMPVAADPHAHAEMILGGIKARVIQRSEFGPLPGFFLWVAPDDSPALTRSLLEAGAVPVNDEAAEVLRVEGGELIFGVDVDETVLLPELRREDLISYTKGCYIGQELVARVKYRGHVNRALAGLRLEGETVPPPGAPVMADGKEIGRVTSSTRSLALGLPIALGYLRREHLEPGTQVTVGAGEPLIPARVAALPFV